MFFLLFFLIVFAKTSLILRRKSHDKADNVNVPVTFKHLKPVRRSPAVCMFKHKVTAKRIATLFSLFYQFFLSRFHFSIRLCSLFINNYVFDLWQKMSVKHFNRQFSIILNESTVYGDVDEAHLHCLLEVIIMEWTWKFFKTKKMQYLFFYFVGYD